MTEESAVPPQLHYTPEHEWVQISGPDGSVSPVGGRAVVRIGITDYAQAALGDIVFVQLPELGAAVSKGDAIGEVESTKSVSDLYAPLTGTVTARNDSVETNPELANTEPYGQGWLIELTVEDSSDIDGLLDAPAYQRLLAG